VVEDTAMTDLPPEFFRRQDEDDDALFYRRPRTAPHLDDGACRVVCALYGEILPSTGVVLDLMASVDSHLRDTPVGAVGLGLNREELTSNERLAEHVIHDLNQDDGLPFGERVFDGAVCTAAVQYLTRPCRTFAEVGRVLRPGAPFIVSFSVRMFPTKAVLAWRASDDAAHLRLVEHYFHASAAFGPVARRLHVPESGDPLYALWAHAKAPAGDGR
jgi:SAM-dependent methyltransferase